MSATWRILNEGRAWTGEEVRERLELLPEKLEIVEGRLLWSEEERRALLGMLLENLGADAAMRLGEREVWYRAVAKIVPGQPLRRVPHSANDVPLAMRVLRGLRGWSPDELARAAGLSREVVVDLEAGRTSHLGMDELGKLLSALNADYWMVEELRRAHYELAQMMQRSERRGKESTGVSSSSGSENGSAPS